MGQQAIGISPITYTVLPPVANNDSYTTNESTPLVTTAANGVLANDVGGGLTVTTTGTIATAHGSVVLNADGSFTYTPTSGYTGTDTFNYSIQDSAGQTASATVTITITPTTPATTANTVTTSEDTPYTFAAANFPLTGPAGETLQSVTVVTLPATGTLKLTGVNVTARQVITAANIANLTYTPVNGGFDGPSTRPSPSQVTDGQRTHQRRGHRGTVNVRPRRRPGRTPSPPLEDTAFTFAAANFPGLDRPRRRDPAGR